METSGKLFGSFPTPSPSGAYLASLSGGKLRIISTQAPEKCTNLSFKFPAREVSAFKWSRHGTHILIFSPRHIEIVKPKDNDLRVRLDNGSGGLGRFSLAEFVGDEHLLVFWEFGKAKIWDLRTGKSVDIQDFKTACDGRRWEIRPNKNDEAPQLLACLSRSGADDVLNLQFPETGTSLPVTRLSTVDAKSLCWSPDGRWLAVVDTPTASPNVYIYTPDGFLFRSWSAADDLADENISLGAKALVWSSNSEILAISGYDGKVTLLNTKTFTPLAQVEHTTTIDKTSADAWQEVISASSSRSYINPPQPVSPPLSHPKPSPPLSELGVAEMRFSCDGKYLATRDERMLNTLWIWDTNSLSAHSVFVQHSNIRRVHWHSTHPSLLGFDCGEGIVYLLDVDSQQPPSYHLVDLPPTPIFSFLPSCSGHEPVVLASVSTSFTILYPYGRSASSDMDMSLPLQQEAFDEGASVDSLADILTGKTPLPEKVALSYTEQVDWAAEAEAEEDSAHLDDTFREKRKPQDTERDPLDDSDIF